jgi:hypothetical protein
MQHSLSPVALRVLGPLALLVSPEVEPVPEVKSGSDGLFLSTLRANLHAAARHVALGHAGLSFRECPGPACREASRLIPELDPAQGAATDAELDAILVEVLISLEKEGTPFPAPEPS